MMVAVVGSHKRSGSDVSVSEESKCGSLEEVDLESGVLELKKKQKLVEFSKVEKICRICHSGFDGGGFDSSSSGVSVDLGCACKGDLGSAHKQCAETWFKIKGDTVCEICGAVAFNVHGEQTNEVTGGTSPAYPPPLATSASMAETHGLCHGRHVMNFLLACIIIVFVTSWLFHFKVL